MLESKKLSLLSAIIININIMLGSGIFINSAILAKNVKATSSIMYLIVAILFLPLVLTISNLVLEYKENSNFYEFGNIISPFFGFLSSFLYFFGKLGSCTLNVHIFSIFLQNFIKSLNNINTIFIDLFIVLFFTILNSFNIKINKNIQYSFIFLKLLPIIFVIFSGLYLFNLDNISSNEFIISKIPFSIPLVIYAFSGFEATCSLSQSIENPSKNGPKAILISYIIVALIYFIYQFSIFSSIGNYIISSNNNYINIFNILVDNISKNLNINFYNYILINLLNSAIAFSSLGSFYGILYSNSWNLYNLSKKDLFFFNGIIKKLNKFEIPIFALIAESIIIIIYLIISKANQVSLQQISAFGSTIAYLISSFALLKLSKNNIYIKYLSYCSILSCLILAFTFFYNASINGLSTIFLIYISFISILSLSFYIKHKPRYDKFENI